MCVYITLKFVAGLLDLNFDESMILHVESGTNDDMVKNTRYGIMAYGTAMTRVELRSGCEFTKYTICLTLTGECSI